MSKNKLFSGKISRLEITLRLGFYILGTIIISISIILAFFLYNKFYLTLTQAEEIIILKSQMAINSLNLELFQKVKDFEANRQATSTFNFNDLKNPFAL